DAGTTWTTTVAGANGYPNGVISGKGIFVSGTNIYAASYTQGLLLSTDTGTNWTIVTNGTVGFAATANINGVYAVGNTIFAATDSGLSISTDAGTTWSTVTSGTNGFPASNMVNAVYATGTAVYVGTAAGFAVSTD